MDSTPTNSVIVKGKCNKNVALKEEVSKVKREKDRKADSPKFTFLKFLKFLKSRKKKKSKVPKEPFPLMRLPAEIRRMVYKEILVMPGEVGIPMPKPFRDYKTQPYVRKFFLTSKAVYAEAMPIYFGLNTFYFHKMSYMEDFLKHTAVDHRRCIRRVSFKFYGTAPARALKLLRECVSLEYLHVKAGVLYTLGGKHEHLMSAHGLNNLLKIRGIKKLEVTCNDPPDRYSPIDWDCFLGALQLLKEPHTPQFLRLQEKKDYPPDKAKRTVFGKTNVITRSEAKLKKSGEEALDSLVE
ncbi:MAG: hypothetical protein Q9167_005583 [Letrouitia subvulpina]